MVGSPPRHPAPARLFFGHGSLEHNVAPPQRGRCTRQIRPARIPLRAPDKIGAKIRLARLVRVHYKLGLGARGVEKNTVSVRHRDRDDLAATTLHDFIETIQKEIRERSL